MNNTLSQEQKDEIRRSILHSTFIMDIAVRRLVGDGFDEATAQYLVINEVKAFKQEIVEKALRKKKEEEARGIAFVVVVLVSLVGTIFNVHSLTWMIASMLIAGGAGYFAFRDKPVAGILSFITFAIVFPFTYTWYLKGRTSYINIELLIPMFVAIVPAAVVYFGVAFTVHANTEDN
jgi:hypothetical protein